MLIAFFFYLQQVNADNTINPVNTVDTITSKDSEYYYVDDGLEGFAKAIKPAVENYLNQNVSDSVESRNARLSLYFTGDSPIYDYGQNIITSTITKSSGVVTSIMSSNTDSSNPTFDVIVELSTNSNNQKSSETRAYLVVVKEIGAKSYAVYDISQEQL